MLLGLFVDVVNLRDGRFGRCLFGAGEAFDRKQLFDRESRREDALELIEDGIHGIHLGGGIQFRDSGRDLPGNRELDPRKNVHVFPGEFIPALAESISPFLAHW